MTMLAYYGLMGFVFLFAVVIQLILPALVSPTLPFGVRIPGAYAHEPAIAEIRRAYLLQTVVGALIVGAATAVLTTVTDEPLVPAGGLMAFLIVAWAIYYGAHRRLRAIKADQGWYAGQRQAVVVDPALRQHPTPVPWAWALPAILMLLVTVALGIWRYPSLPETLTTHWNARGEPDGFAQKSIVSAFSPVAVQSVVTAMLLGLVWVIPRFRQELDVEQQPEQAVAQYRAYQTALSKSVLLLAACTNLSMLVTVLQIWQVTDLGMGATMVAVSVPIVVGLIGTLWFAVRVGQAGARLRPSGAATSGYVNRDDDRFWRAGSFYVNRDDPALFVNKRFGIGWTLNLGHPLGWIILLAMLATPLVITVAALAASG
ncbi:MAG: DUF5808 domain-containing protein [Sphaerobacter sp.]|nr:DUF5808 domain-containing protein [Sphaerobacter sp.]